jgi:hypothetical protein
VPVEKFGCFKTVETLRRASPIRLRLPGAMRAGASRSMRAASTFCTVAGTWAEDQLHQPIPGLALPQRCD